MHIGIYDPYLDTLAGGEKYMFTAATCLARDNKVSIFWDPQQAEKIKHDAERKLGINLSNIHFVKNIFSHNTSFYKRFWESRKYDLIIILSDGSLPLLQCPLVVHFQSPLEWVNGATVKNKIKLSRIKQIICNSYFTKSFIDRKFHVNSTVVYPPVDVSHQFNDNEKENIILNVGRFGIKRQGSSYKKQEVLAEVFEKMINDGLKGWKLVFVVSIGEDQKEELNTFKKLIKGFPIVLVENPSNDVLWSLYKKAKIYWHAAGFGEDIKKNPDRAEHFGISTVEAMSVGAVPIVYNAGGQTEIVQGSQSGFLWDTKEILIERTNEIIKDESLWNTYSKKAINRAGDFSQQRFCKEIMSLFK